MNVIIPLLSKVIVNLYATEAIRDFRSEIKKVIQEYGITNHAGFLEKKKEIFDNHYKERKVAFFSFSETFRNNDDKLRDFLKNRILNSHLAQSMDGKAEYVLKKLFKAYISNPQQLPDDVISRMIDNYEKEVVKNDSSDSCKKNAGEARDMISQYLEQDDFKVFLLRSICDFIAGMTDQFAYSQYNQLYGVKINRNI